MCGVNCLYLLLQTNGIQANYAELQTTLLHEKLNSFAELKASALQYGVAATIGKTNPDSLKTLVFPLIAHLEIVDPRGETSGHFVLLTKYQGNGVDVEYIDGTTAELCSLPENPIRKCRTRRPR